MHEEFTPTPRTDPLLAVREVVVPGIAMHLLPLPVAHKEFYLDHSGYMELVNHTYDKLAEHGGFAINVSRAMFTYYCVTLLWRRLLYINSEHGKNVVEYTNVMRHLPMLRIPRTVGLYLDGIGDFKDAYAYWELRLAADLSENEVSGLTGHFGVADQVSHIVYETLPSPFISLFRIAMDCCYTESTAPVALWSPPQGVRPNSADLRPTRNLLGWAPAKELTTEQIMVLLNSGVRPQPIGPGLGGVDGVVVGGTLNISGLPINRKIHEWVNSNLTTYCQRESDWPGSTTTRGSMAQALYIERRTSDSERGVAPDRMEPVSKRDGTPYMRDRGCAYMVSACNIFRYRVNRIVAGSPDCLSYTDGKGGAPARWMDTANRIFDAVPEWNHSEFVGQIGTPDVVVKEYVERQMLSIYDQ